MAKYEFAIKKDLLNSGKIIFTPVCRKKFLFNIFSNPWERITKIYDQFTIMELHFIPELTQKECEEHIQGYQEVLLQTTKNQIAVIEFHSFEEQEI